MIRKKTFAIALAGAFAIGGAGVLYAQAAQNGMTMSGMMGTMQGCPMMAAMAEGPESALHHAERLDLTPDQVERLESLRDGTSAAQRSAMERMPAIHREIAAAADEDFDEPALREAFGRMGDLHEEIGIAALRARHETSRVLTAEQRETLESLRPDPMDVMGSMGAMGGMHGKAGGHGMGMMGMMKNCPMMRHGPGHGSSEGHGSSGHGQ